MKKFTLSLVLPLALMLGACQSNIDAAHYESSSVGRASATEMGTILNVRRINVSTSEGTVGTLAGGGAGAALGSMVGGSSGVQVASAIGGAVIGGMAGNKAQEALSSQGGFEFVVKLDNGRILTVTQGEDIILTPGDRCIVILGNPARVIPYN